MDKNIIMITGVTAGIGEAAAKLFCIKGWKVIGTGRRGDRLKQLSQELGENFLPLEFDVKNREEVDNAIRGIPDAFKNIDVLVNNAGRAAGSSKIQDSSVEDWEQIVQTNILGLLYCTKAVLPGMLQRKKGLIINISSFAARRGGSFNVYGSSKAFVTSFSDNLKADLLGTPIKVTCLAPGRTKSEFALVKNHGDKEIADKFYEKGEPLKSEDIAEAIWWITSCPPRVDIMQLEIIPTTQASNGGIVRDLEK